MAGLHKNTDRIRADRAMKIGNAENNYNIPEEDRTVIVNTKMVKCDNDHPVVWYSLEDGGFAVCGYCDMKYVYAAD